MFITVSKGMFGYFVCLADDAGPIERLDTINYDTYDECERNAIQLAIEYNIRYL